MSFIPTEREDSNPIRSKLMKYLCLIDNLGSCLYKIADGTEEHAIKVIDVALIHALDFGRTRRADERTVANVHVTNYWRKHRLTPVLSKPLEEIIDERYDATEAARQRQVRWANGKRLSKMKKPPSDRASATIRRHLANQSDFRGLTDDWPGKTAQEISKETGLPYEGVRKQLQRMTNKGEIIRLEEGRYGMTDIQVMHFHETQAAIQDAIDEHASRRSQDFRVLDHCRVASGKLIPMDDECRALWTIHDLRFWEPDGVDRDFLRDHRPYRKIDWSGVVRSRWQSGWSAEGIGTKKG